MGAHSGPIGLDIGQGVGRGNKEGRAAANSVISPPTDGASPQPALSLSSTRAISDVKKNRAARQSEIAKAEKNPHMVGEANSLVSSSCFAAFKAEKRRCRKDHVCLQKAEGAKDLCIQRVGKTPILGSSAQRISPTHQEQREVPPHIACYHTFDKRILAANEKAKFKRKAAEAYTVPTN